MQKEIEMLMERRKRLLMQKDSYLLTLMQKGFEMHWDLLMLMAIEMQKDLHSHSD
jgi:hypothetical protein